LLTFNKTATVCYTAVKFTLNAHLGLTPSYLIGSWPASITSYALLLCLLAAVGLGRGVRYSFCHTAPATGACATSHRKPHGLYQRASGTKVICQIGRPHPGLANCAIGARGNGGVDHSQLIERSKAVGQANKQSETFGNTVGPRSCQQGIRRNRENPQGSWT